MGDNPLLVGHVLGTVIGLHVVIDTIFLEKIEQPIHSSPALIGPSADNAAIGLPSHVALQLAGKVGFAYVNVHRLLEARVDGGDARAERAGHLKNLCDHHAGTEFGQTGSRDQSAVARPNAEHIDIDCLDDVILGDDGCLTQPISRSGVRFRSALVSGAGVRKRLRCASGKSGDTQAAKRCGPRAQKAPTGQGDLLVKHNFLLAN